MTLDLDALEAAARAATPGPWGWDARLEPDVVRVAEAGGDFPPGPDARYIAAAHPAAVLALIARVRAAESQLSALRDAIAVERGIAVAFRASLSSRGYGSTPSCDGAIGALDAALARAAKTGGGS